ncbi:MAG: D-alanyl-D-alanine carboxypeptidase family protein [Pseudomonadota bacterium]
MRPFPLIALALSLIASTSLAEQTTPARAALVIDMATGAVLLEKDADEPLPPASMSKLMTLYMVFEALEQGRLSLDDTFAVSAKAQGMGGSTMYLDTRDKVSVEDLILGIIVQSGNDACVVVAEGLAGSEAAFADLMTQRGREIGLTGSVFANSTGWPHPDHRMTIRDLVTLSTRLIEDFPQYYPYFAETEFDFDGRAPANRFNRNPLLGLDIGADGLKTGHTAEAGFGLTASALRNGRRVVLAVTGLETQAQRRQETERLVNWAFRAFEAHELYPAGTQLAEAEVWLGEEGSVPLVTAEEITAIVPAGRLGEAQLTARFDSPVEAPIAEGATLGTLEISAPGMAPVTVPLLAAHGVARGGFLARLTAAGRLVLADLMPGD